MGRKKKILPPKQMVTCVDCGKRFNKNRLAGVHYEHHGQRNRYICPQCYKKRTQARKTAANERDKTIQLAAAQGAISEDAAKVMTHNTSKAKLIVGIILAAIGLIGLAGAKNGVAYIITCVVFMAVGALLLFLHFKAQKEYKTALENEAARTAIKTQEEENATKVCPSCGATTKGHFCEYCGSKLDE